MTVTDNTPIVIDHFYGMIVVNVSAGKLDQKKFAIFFVCDFSAS